MIAHAGIAIAVFIFTPHDNPLNQCLRSLNDLPLRQQAENSFRQEDFLLAARFFNQANRPHRALESLEAHAVWLQKERLNDHTLLNLLLGRFGRVAKGPHATLASEKVARTVQEKALHGKPNLSPSQIINIVDAISMSWNGNIERTVQLLAESGFPKIAQAFQLAVEKAFDTPIEPFIVDLVEQSMPQAVTWESIQRLRLPTDDDHYYYLVHGLAHRVSLTDPSMNPSTFLLERDWLSASLISRRNLNTFGNYGFILSVDSKAIIKIFNQDAGTNRVDQAQIENWRSEPVRLGPEDLMRRTPSNRHNEIILDPRRGAVEIIGVFVQITGKIWIVDDKTEKEIRAFARNNHLPLVEVNRFLEPDPSK